MIDDVFNERYDDDLNDCQYDTYTIDVQAVNGKSTRATMTFSAAQFAPPE